MLYNRPDQCCAGDVLVLTKPLGSQVQFASEFVVNRIKFNQKQLKRDFSKFLVFLIFMPNSKIEYCL